MLSDKRPGRWVDIGDNWILERVSLELNGVQVLARTFENKIARPGESINLRYPGRPGPNEEDQLLEMPTVPSTGFTAPPQLHRSKLRDPVTSR